MKVFPLGLLAVGAGAGFVPDSSLWGGMPGLHKIALDKAGKACDSVLASRAECPEARRGPQNTDGAAWGRWCNVNAPDAKLCKEPTIATLGNGMEVQKTITLVTKSDPDTLPVTINRVVDAVDYTERAEYRFDYIAQNDEGKVVKTIQFHMFIIDHAPPRLTKPDALNGKRQASTYVPLDRYHYSAWREGHETLDEVGEYELPKGMRAVDGYDGDMSRTIRVKHTDPSGLVNSATKPQDVKIDLRNFGEHTVEYTAHDRANFFGRDYRNNAIAKVASVHVYKGRVVYTWKGTRAPTPAPTPPPTPRTVPLTHAPTPPPTPTACAMSKWSAWGKCSANHCGIGTRRRTRTVLTPAAPNGSCGQTEALQNCVGAFGRHWEPCAPHCEWKWGAWSPCNKQCGTGVQMRIATITKRPVPPRHYNSFWSPNCPGGEMRVCNKQECATPAPTPVPTPAPTPKSWVSSYKREGKIVNEILGVKGAVSHWDAPNFDPLLDTEAPKLALDMGKDKDGQGHFLYDGKSYKQSDLTYYQIYAKDHPSERV